ncbi:aminotransferase-like domain-containing protein [Plastoroseomonas hellenica]|uniref:aminotransferase-like domain-containing protein n=1 Tax=Plastoroseomonas hellenica TaxID=2687306 RepID=UPI0020133BF5|nr:PLP-dependent aminotransferase family protein [Plastoroseomonas hellenica]
MPPDRMIAGAERRNDWTPDLNAAGQPHYLAIADAIAADLAASRLSEGDRLPPQRLLAKRLGLDFTTVARGYAEAQRRGLVEAVVGRGSYVRAPAPLERKPGRRRSAADFSMNLPPEPADPTLVERMQAGFEEVGRDILAHLRYQAFGGSAADKDAAAGWLARRGLRPPRERLFVTPGAHPAIQAILGLLTRPGDAILSEGLTYPGLRGLAGQAGLRVLGLPEDAEGIDPEALDDACRREAPKLLYLNPTLRNPTTRTVSAARRIAIAEVARRHALPILEDDAYGFLPARGPAPFAALLPELTWHLAGLSKCFGAGLRVAYVVAPGAGAALAFAAVARSVTVMASPLTVALTTRWLEDGTADAILRFVRVESAARQALAAGILPEGSILADPIGFHLWLSLPPPWTRSAFLDQVRVQGVGLAASDAFAVTTPAPEALRVCLGGPADREAIREALEDIAEALRQAPTPNACF